MQLFGFKNFLWCATVLAAWAALWNSYGCAGLGQPTGGPRDSTAPTLVKAVPEILTTNFTAKTIVLNFDEYVDLDNPFKNLIINPPPESFPQVDRKLRTVTIRIKDTLEPNTTYSMRFDGVVKDVNEGNPMEDFSYVFSTGKYIDSLSVMGQVTNAQTGAIDSTLVVMLHRNLDDSAVAKEKPRYITTLNGEGFFKFDYLAPGTYNIFALKDEGLKRYNDSSIPFAFYNKPITLGEAEAEPVELLFFVAKEDEPRQAPATGGTGLATGRDKGKEPEEKPFTFQVSLESGAQDLLTDFVITFNRPIQSYDSSLLLFSDTLFRPITNYKLQLDTSATQLNLKHTWKDNTWYSLLFNKGFAQDSAGKTKAKTDTLRFKTKAESEYGNLKIGFAGLDFNQNPVLQWVQNGKLVKSIPLVNASYTDKLFVPGQYDMRILLDANKNGIWDTGDYWTNRQPERVIAIYQKFTIRANWDNEFEVDLSANEKEEEEKK